MAASSAPLTFDEMVIRLAAVLGFDPSGCNAASGLYDSLGLDSTDATELVLAVEALAECENSALDLPVMLTLGDVFAYYLRLVDDTSA